MRLERAYGGLCEKRVLIDPCHSRGPFLFWGKDTMRDMHTDKIDAILAKLNEEFPGSDVVYGWDMERSYHKFRIDYPAPDSSDMLKVDDNYIDDTPVAELTAKIGSAEVAGTMKRAGCGNSWTLGHKGFARE